MKVFLSSSGSRSRAIATALHDWLPKVLQSLQPWMSAADIEKGTRWSADITTQLEQAQVGIICLTPENVAEPWVLFEAGALSKTLQNTFVCTYLFGVEATDLSFPLALFQATKADKDDTRKLLTTVNRALGSNAIPDGRLTEIFEVWWPKLSERLQAVSNEASQLPKQPKRSDHDVLSEILNIVRDQAKSSYDQANDQANAQTNLEDTINTIAATLQDICKKLNVGRREPRW